MWHQLQIKIDIETKICLITSRMGDYFDINFYFLI